MRLRTCLSHETDMSSKMQNVAKCHTVNKWIHVSKRSHLIREGQTAAWAVSRENGKPPKEAGYFA